MYGYGFMKTDDKDAIGNNFNFLKNTRKIKFI